MTWFSSSDVRLIRLALQAQASATVAETALIENVLEKVDKIGTLIMNFGTETLALLKQIDTETTSAADRIAAKIDQAMAGTVDPATQDQVRAAVATELDRLRGLAADPQNPIPPTPPVATAA